MRSSAFALLLAALWTVSAYAEPAQQFCTMDQGVDRILAVADIPDELARKPIVRDIASDIVGTKLRDNPGQPLEITWKDIYDLRGTVNAWLCNEGNKMNCVGQALDAVGSGLTGTTPGKILMGVGLALSGPPGFVLMGGMAVTQETFQCQPSAVNMAITAGASVVVSLPWCKVPGVNQACVAAGKGMKEGALAAARKIFGDKVAVQAVKQGKNGVEVVLVDAEREAKKAMAAAAAKPGKVSSNITSKLSPGGKKPEINFDGGGSRVASGETGVQLAPRTALAKTSPQKQLAAVYAKAPAAKAEIDALSDGIAKQLGGRVAKAPLKGQERALEKVIKDYGGDASQIKDIARNTIIVGEKQYGQAVAILQNQGAKVKTITSAADPLGYSGTNVVIRTKAGIPAEIQVNTPGMIYAKESPANASKILGEAKYAELRMKAGVEGGRGHALYEKYRKLNPNNPKEAKLAAEIAAESRAYYDYIRKTLGGQ
jgi:hypothetical protein